MLHASHDFTIQQMNLLEIFRWSTVDVYQSLANLGVPIFIMLTGALLLQPSKDESLSAFFKKRWARIGLPILFWGAAYFVWDFLVEHQAFTSNAIINGILTGPYYQFWYIYMLIGLYVLTPILRILVANAERKILTYFLILWFLGVSISPLLGFLTIYHLDNNVLILTGFVGYFILGMYLQTVRIRRPALLIFVSLGVALTAFGTYLIATNIGGRHTYFLQQSLSPTIIFSSVMVFLLLNTFQPPSNINKENSSKPQVNRLLKVISQNTLPIFLFHVIVLESLQRGYFGFAINGNTINSIIGVPLITLITLFICLGVIVPLKKIPVLKKLIG